MAKVKNMALLFVFAGLLTFTAVQSKSMFNEHGEMITDTEEDQDAQNIDKGSDINQDSDEDKRTYKPRVHRPIYYQPRLSCGKELYHPTIEVCCCGKKYKKTWGIYGYKRVQWKCCGYKYINGYLNKCCPYFTIISNKHKCPRSKV